MKRQKRDKSERAFVRGYQLGFSGKSRDLCPHDSEGLRQSWLSGWREGRTDQWEGSVGMSALQR
jgi:ribosome modulation factor